jgi:hypothetical protein
MVYAELTTTCEHGLLDPIMALHNQRVMNNGHEYAL